MKTPPPIRRLLLLWLSIFTIAARADDAPRPDEAKVRAALVKSLAYLDKEGDVWLNEQTCNGCHHMPELLWSHREAKRRGFAIDQKLFDEFVEWADSHAQDGKAGNEMMALMKLAMPDKPAPELTKLIVTAQQPDGSWKPAGQFASMQRREARDATVNSTRLFLLALGTQEADQEAAEIARKKAAALIETNEPAKSLETLVFRTLYAQRFGKSEDAGSLRKEILGLQHPDGGWAYIIGEEQSDSLATGQALYVLQDTPDAAPADAIARGQNWLLNRQREDGGWSIDITRISKVSRSGPEKAKSFKNATGIYTFWGSAWATIGLLQGLPITAPATP